jgi:LDH2 family malate/lactate/ureidoglycolate dehydrogenase
MYRYPNDPSNTAHLMIVIKPLALISKQQMKERMSDFIKTIKKAPMWDPDSEMLLPGEIEYRKEQERRRDGIPLSAALYDELAEIGSALNLDAALERTAA